MSAVHRWHREPTWAPDNPAARSLPPPPLDAVSSPGPASWAAPLAPPTVVAGIELPPPGADAVAARKVGDAFELIWPTGEVDDQLLGEPRSEVPPPVAPLNDTLPPSNASPASEPITVRLRPLTAPPDVMDSSRTGPVPDDVVLAVQRAITAIQSDPGAVDEPASAPRLPELSSGSVAAASDDLALTATDVDPTTIQSPSKPTDERRSALKRLISGLRHR